MADKIHCAGTDNIGRTFYQFHCPGCGNDHAFRVPNWTWNGSMDKPTFSPSLLCNKDDSYSRCHLFVVNGKVQYLNDCHHALKDLTVDLPDWED